MVGQQSSLKNSNSFAKLERPNSKVSFMEDLQKSNAEKNWKYEQNTKYE